MDTTTDLVTDRAYRDLAPLFEPFQLGSLTLPNRFVMSPMTRGRSPGGIPGEDVAGYYWRLAEAGVGLIVTEGIGIDQSAAIGSGSMGEDNVPQLHGEAATVSTILFASQSQPSKKVHPPVNHQPDFPTSADGITPQFLTSMMAQTVPGAVVTQVRTINSKAYGEQFVSTAGRVVVDVTYGADSPADLPARLVIKIARGVDKIMAPFYENEVNFYERIRPELKIEAPRCFGAGFDAETTNFAIVLEDLGSRGAIFPNVLSTVSLDSVRSLLSQQARLHAGFWDSPRLRAGGDLAWAGSHVEGKVAQLLMHGAEPMIQHEIDTVPHKREMVQRLRTTGVQLRSGTLALHRHQQLLPQTLVQGDMHVGNTYLLPDGLGGLLDWQLTCRGHHMHDVSYLVTTALSVEDRRLHERDLVRFYLERLSAEGVADLPSFEDSFVEFGRCLIWGVYIGWLTTPVVNYGWEINVMNHLRLTTAFEDHDTSRLIAQLS